MRPAAVPIVRLWLAVLLGYLALGATLQELPTYLTDRFNADPLMVGVTVALAFAGTAATRPFAGRAGDRGHARLTAAGGAGLTAIAAAGHLLAPQIGWLLMARVLMGVGEAALFSGVLPWVLSATEPSRAGRVAGWFGLSMWSGLAAGPLIATAIPGSTAVWTTVIALPIVACALITSTRAYPPQAVLPLAPGRRTLIPAGVAQPAVILALAAYGYGTLTAVLVLFLGTNGLGGQGLGLVVFSATFLLTRAAGSPLVDRLGGHRIARIVLLAEAAGLALLAVATAEAAALGAVAVIGIGLGLIYPATSKLVLAAVPGADAGGAVGAMTSFWDIGILLAGPVGGLIAASVGYRPAFAVAAIAAASALVVSFRARLDAAPRQKQSSRAVTGDDEVGEHADSAGLLLGGAER